MSVNVIHPRVIAFYLPQFHPIPENNLWWGKGFTEWTNVGKAKPLFPGHNQPKVPTDLGYYDLRLIDNIKAQVELAKEAGIEGFCWWHYYFGNGKQLLEKPLQMVLEDTSIDFPFCLGWANESWEKKLWNNDSSGDETLIEQRYCGKNDYRQHFNTILPYLKDERYIKVDGNPIFLIYKPDKFEDCKNFISYWRELAHKTIKTDIHFIAHAATDSKNFDRYFALGFDAVYSNRVRFSERTFQGNILKTFKYLFSSALGMPRMVDFKTVRLRAKYELDRNEKIYPGIICGWDHTPRSGNKGMVYTNFSLSLFKRHIEDIVDLVSGKAPEHRIIFLKSWNEWGEGNFMEPDMEFGTGKIETLRNVIDGISDCLTYFP